MADFLEPDDNLETRPADLHALFIPVVTSSLSKRLAADGSGKWTQALETAHQEKIAALVGAARERGLTTVTMISVKPDGRRIAREISLDKISKDRVLQ